MSNRVARLQELQRLLDLSSVSELENCTKISLKAKAISSVPLGVWDLTQLVVLWLQNNKLSAVPPEITRLSKLQEFNIYSNALVTLTPDISRLTGLTGIWLTWNQLSALPQEIYFLTGLKELQVGGNRLSSLSPELSRLTGLTELGIFDNMIEELPLQITSLKKLEMIYLESKGNMRVRRAPRGISSLPCWNNTGMPWSGMTLSFSEALRRLELYDPVPIVPAHYADSRLASGRFADALTAEFEKQENVLGKGGFGIVFKAQLKAGLFAIKKVGDAAFLKSTDGINPVEEGELMLSLKHENILALFDYGFRGKDLLFIMEFANGGELCSLIEKSKGLGYETTVKYGLHIIQGLVFLHTRPKPIQHRDLKTENVLIVNGIAKLTDFGLSKSGASVNSVSGFKGSKNWSPPEAFEVGKSMGLPSDVFSYGVVLWSMLSGEYPYKGMTLNEVGALVMSGKPLPLPPSTPSNLVALIHKCWERSYEMRIKAMLVEAELKEVIRNPLAPAAAVAVTVKSMSTEQLVRYLEEKKVLKSFIDAIKEGGYSGSDFLDIEECDLEAAPFVLRKVQARAILNIIEDAKRK